MNIAKKTIITCAVTGNITRKDQTDALPVTPEEIAQACIGAAKEGAAIAHIHVRDPATGAPSMSVDLYRDVVERVRSSGTDVIINLTTGPGGRFLPGEQDPKVYAPGTTLTTPYERVRHVIELKPEICSLDLNTMFSGSSVVINTPTNVTEMARLIQESKVRPELEVFDTGDIHLGRDLIASGILKAPAYFQIVLGIKYGASATLDTLRYMQSLLPADAHWSAFGIGRMEFPILAHTFLMGGHVRVGLEDNIYLERGVLAPDNATLVAKAVRIIRELGGQIATPNDARAILDL
jgi:uncharacterized protein (DUF849 family)